MADNNMKDSLNALFEGLDGFLTTKTAVGNPVNVNDSLILPLMDVQLGVGAGSLGSKATGTGGGMGLKVSPSAVLILQKDGASKLISVKNQDTVTKILDMVPEVITKIKEKKVKDPEAEKKAEDILNGKE